MPAAAANAGRTADMIGSALASLRTVAFTLDIGVRSPEDHAGQFVDLPGCASAVNRTRIGPGDCECVQRIGATCGESPMWSVREQALYWTDNLGGCIYRLEPERGREQRIVLGQNVMAIGLREGA